MPRLASRLSAPLVLCAALSAGIPAGIAHAQSGPGWVDPPAKPAPKAAPEAQKAPEPARSADAPSAEPARNGRRAERPERSRRAERAARHEPRHSERRRTAPGPAPVPAEAMPPASLSPDRLADLAAASESLTRAYLDSVSAPGARMLAQTPSFYGTRVRFHGRSMSLAALTAEKRRFVERWPERRYELRREPLTSCSPALGLCRVEAVFDFRAANPARGSRSEGVSSLSLEIGFAGGRPVIVSESSRVLHRDSSLSALRATRGPA